MAIQNRRGAYADFVPSKMLPGEIAVVQSGDTSSSDGKSVYVAFQSGNVKRLATYTDIQTEVAKATEELVQEVKDAVADDVERAEEAARHLTIDNTLTQSGQAADAKKTGDEIAQLKDEYLEEQTEESDWIRKKFVILNVDPVDLTPTANAGIDCIILDCVEGDIFSITASGGNQSRAWAFVDSNSHVLSVADAITQYTDLRVTAPANAVKLVVNNVFGSGFEGHVYRITNVVADLEDRVSVLEQQEPGLSAEAKTALLACFEHVAWIDEHGPDYYQALAEALDAQVDVLTAVYTPKNRTVYADDPVDSLKYFLDVKWNGEAVAVNDFTVSGSLVAGDSIITVAYNRKTVNVTVPVEAIKWRLSFADNDIQLYNGSANKWASDSSGFGGATLNPNNINRTFVSPKGRHPYYLDNGTFQTDKFPVPVPKNATSVTITPTPSTYYTAINCQEYHPDRGSVQPYTTLSPEVGFGSGARTLQLPAAETAFGMRTINFNIRGSSSYTDATNPTGCVIQFN